MLGIGILTASVRNESDPAIALLSEHVEAKSGTMKTSAILGYVDSVCFWAHVLVFVKMRQAESYTYTYTSLGIAYAGKARDDVMELLLPIISDTGVSMELASFAALSLGTVFVGTCHGDIVTAILTTMMERDEIQLKDTYGKFMALGLALLYLGKQDVCEPTLETLKAIETPLAKQAGVLVEAVAYAGMLGDAVL